MKSDAQLRMEIFAALFAEPRVNAGRIGVDVRDGIVTLSGWASSYVEKWEAERAAQRVAGVKDVDIEMEVTPLWFEQAT